VPGLLHIHTNRSDGRSAPDEIAAIASRAGLKFLVFTDHGDATRSPDAPAYRSGVLCLDGVEISTNDGHYIAFDMPAAPYPLGGEGRDVVEDVRRLGGFGIAAHPDSPKAQLRWDEWQAPFDAIELLNPDTSWRVLAAQGGWRPKERLAAAFLAYPLRAREAIASLVQPPAVVERWVALAARRRVVAIAGTDAHAKLALRNADPGDSSMALPIPGYEPSFRAMSIRARLDRPLSGNAAADAATVVRALRNGHLYAAVDGVASPPSFTFTAANANGTVSAGDVLGAAGPVELRVRSNAPAGFRTLVHDGVRVISSVESTADLTVHGPEGPGVFWAEVVANTGSPPITWIRSNPVYVRGSSGGAQAATPPATVSGTRPLWSGAPADGWRLEHDAKSAGELTIAGAAANPELRFQFSLAGGAAVGQFTALVFDLPEGAGDASRLAFTVRSERPMRLSIQVRDHTADRWQRSVYLDAATEERVVRFEDLVPVGTTHAPLPAVADIRAILFVVDTTNTRPGTSGRIWIRKAALERTAQEPVRFVP
jgi:hypothetical protein